MIELLFFTLIFFVSLSLGDLVLRILNVTYLDSMERWIYSTAVGFAILGYLVFFLGIVALLYSWFMHLILIILALVFFNDIKGKIVSFLISVKREWKNQEFIRGSFNKFLLIIFGVFILINLFSSFAPVTEMDSLKYHTTVPKLYIKKHGIFYIPSIPFSNYPLLVNMMYLLGMLVKNGVMPQLFTFCFSLLLALSLYNFGKKHFNKNIALLASIIFFTVPDIVQRSSEPMVEIAFSFYSFLAVSSFFDWFFCDKHNKVTHLIVSAIMVGLSASVKYTGIAFLPIILLFTACTSLRSKKMRLLDLFKIIALFTLIVVVIVLPWYIKSYIYTGNPFFNFFYNQFGGKDWNQYANENHKRMLGAYGFGKDPISLIMSPWNLTMSGLKFDSFCGVTPIFLAFIPLILLFWKELPKKMVISLCLFFTLFFWVAWFFTSQQVRLLFPIFPILSVLSAYSINFLIRKNILKKVIIFLIVFAFAFNLLLATGINFRKFPVVFGLETKEDYIANQKDFNSYVVQTYASKNLNKTSKILLFGDVRDANLDIDYMWGDSLVQGVIDYSKIKNSEELYKILKDLGITHLIVNTHFFGIFETEHAVNLFTDMIKKHSTLIYQHNKVYLYTLG